MALSIEQIQAPVKDDLENFERKFRQSMKTNVSLLDRIMTYIVKRKGKQIRPLFVFLTARTCGPITEATYRGAALIELLHTATLVHDDVVDDANYRRGFFSINALWKNKVAVLVGDYLLSQGLLLSINNNDFELLKIVSNAVKEMSEGELLQMEKARDLDITEDIYFKIIRQKTASLLSSCCAVGAASVNSNTATIETARLFGEKVGLAFQIKDDLFDYSNDEIGKPTGLDIKEKKMTLPLIHSLSKAGWMEKRKIVNIVKNHSDDARKRGLVIKFVEEAGGIAYATEAMKKIEQDAYIMLQSFPDSVYKQSLEQLVKYTIERRK